MTQAWFDFDIRTDSVFYNTIKPFIEAQMKNLVAYDEQRRTRVRAEFNEPLAYVFHEHAERVAIRTREICKRLGQPENVQTAMYWAMKVHDIGKPELAIDAWDFKGKPTAEAKKHSRQHAELGGGVLETGLAGIDNPFKDLMIDIAENHHDLFSDAMSMPVRLACIVEDFDGRSIRRNGPEWETRDLSPATVLGRMRNEEGKGAAMFDMDLFDQVERIILDDPDFFGPRTPQKTEVSGPEQTKTPITAPTPVLI